MDQKDQSIAAQVALKAAVEHASHDTGVHYAQVVEIAKAFNEFLRGAVTAPAQQGFVPQLVPQQPQAHQPPPTTSAQAVSNVMAGFTGATVAPLQPTEHKPSEEELWADVVSNPDNWYDNRAQGDTSVNGGNRPDFRSKKIKNQKGQPVGLFLKGKFGNAPQWVFERLYGPASQAPQATTGPAAPQWRGPTAAELGQAWVSPYGADEAPF